MKISSANNHSPLQEEVLDLSRAPSTLFLFGLAGSGKSYIGDLIGELCHWHVYHADEDLTDEMLNALANHQPFTPAMRDVFFDKVSRKILQLQGQHDHLVVTQAAYKIKHRNFLLSCISNMDFVMVDTSDDLIEKRIGFREKGISMKSAKALRQDFERPGADIAVVENNRNRAHIIRQLNSLYASKRD